MRQFDPPREAGMSQRPLGGLQHLRRRIEAEQLRIRVLPGDLDQVSTRPRTDLDQPRARLEREGGDQLVAAEEIVLPRQVLDVALMPIDIVHQLRVFDGRALLHQTGLHFGGSRSGLSR
jgi:hypothetical protein